MIANILAWILPALIMAIVILHFWFMILEMFLWQKPIGLKTFGNTPEKARIMSTLAANQGLYNGFLACGLLLGLVLPNPAPTFHGAAFAFRVFFLGCITIAGLYGGITVSRRIFLIQALPAALALLLITLFQV